MLSPDRQRLKERFEERRGYWPEPWTSVLLSDPAWLAAYEQLSHGPSHRRCLDPKLRELVGIAIDASATHLYEDGIRVHVRGALGCGASAGEIMAVLELAGELGAKSATTGATILAELEGGEGAIGDGDPEPDEGRAGELKRRFASLHGAWTEEWQGLLLADPDFFESQLQLSAVGRGGDRLDPKSRELLGLALNIAVTHLDEGAARRHMARALVEGATREEVIAVCEVVSGIGNHALTVATPILREELEAADSPAPRAPRGGGMSAAAFRELASGLGFIEGPVATGDGRVIVTDIEAGTLLSIDPESGEVATLAETGGGPNGLAVGPDGAFYVCNNGGKAYDVGPDGYKVGAPEGTLPRSRPATPGIQRVDADGVVTDLYLECDGQPFVHPNDLVFDDQGGFYFTETGDPQGRVCDLGGLYYGRADGSGVVELLRNSAAAVPLTQPNGVGLSPDGRRLYVAETASGRLWSWAVEGPGELAPLPGGEPLARGGKLVFGHSGYVLFDSLGMEREGNICVGTLVRGGITTIGPDGTLVDFVAVPDFDPFVTNICFGGEDLRTAYITSSGLGKLWQVEWPRPGLSLNHNI